MDPSHEKPTRQHSQPQPIHPLPDPTVAPPPTTVQAISHRFSKLYINHKKHLVADNSDSPAAAEDAHCTALTKSNSHRYRIDNAAKSTKKKDLQPSTKPKANGKAEFDTKKKGFQQKAVVELERRICVPAVIPPGGGRRRKSFGNLQLELSNFLACSGIKVVAADMPPLMQIHAVDCARKALDSLEKFASKTLAFTLKKEFDGAYGPAWHCIVGTSFGSFVTHSVGGFLYFSMDHKHYVLLFQTTVQRAE